MLPHLRIGIIQNAALTADFPNNLRSIVQGYRDCLDHGAELIIAPAAALCGPKPGALTTRRSYLRQTQAALEALSHELGSAPLLLGAYAPLIAEDDESWNIPSGSMDDHDDILEGSSGVSLVPFLIEKDTVTELADAEVTDIAGVATYVDICAGEILLDNDSIDLLVHLADSPWHINAEQQNEDTRRWEAETNGIPVVWAQAVGTSGSNIYAGGSAIYTPEGKPLLRLPFFETANRVAELGGPARAHALPPTDELLQQALTRGIRDNVHQNGYNAVCLPLDHPNTPLLAALSVDALGSANVHGITFGGNSSAANTAEALGISVQRIDISPLLQAADAEPGSSLALRLQASLLMSRAEDQGHMLLCPLGRHDIMLGHFTLYGDSCGLLAPLGNLYRMDIHLLTHLLNESHSGLIGTQEEPAHAVQDRIIHELADRNISPTELLTNNPILFPENDVRLVQRRLVTSALNRTQLPIILHVDAPEERHELPVCHRMND